MASVLPICDGDLQQVLLELDMEVYHHKLGCDLGSRCVTCIELSDVDLRSRIGIARMEYIVKVQKLDPSLSGLCVYCGSFAEQRDHLLPLPWSGKAVRSMVPTVPSCGHCNRTISDFSSPLIIERSFLVATRIRKKFRRELRIVDKAENNLLEYGIGLQTNLRARQFERQRLRARLSILDCGGLPEVPASIQNLLLEAEYVKVTF